MTLFWTEPSAHFAGWVYIQNEPAKAIIQATWASSQPSTYHYVNINLFCDCSRSRTSDEGGIAVVYRPWLPGLRVSLTEILVTEAWPVKPLYDTNLGELLAISESLVIATQQIRQFAETSSTSAQPVIVRIFSDSMKSLNHFQGQTLLRDDIQVLASPVLDLIAQQSAALHQQGVMVHLELHWIPGHGHHVQPHVEADAFSRLASVRQTAYSTITGNRWPLHEEASVVRHLHQQMADAAYKAADHIAGLGDRLPSRLPQAGSPSTTSTETSSEPDPR
ncbi:uncharacterized protein B0H64DRAFT_478739 [Chaetomium fimeti]|uniref:RNase H type-1 domain-containing protein n=1 Tax=Chaetomium fimeti TaxID=1854472 RepID=A0AAE0LMS3_9PEZI|nr:hypothetical protein B0H64DRAFT_478739 [Chaetomium fimeti]